MERTKTYHSLAGEERERQIVLWAERLALLFAAAFVGMAASFGPLAFRRLAGEPAHWSLYLLFVLAFFGLAPFAKGWLAPGRLFRRFGTRVTDAGNRRRVAALRRRGVHIYEADQVWIGPFGVEIGPGAGIRGPAAIGSHACISSGAELQPGVKVEPHAQVEGVCRIGQGAVIGSRAHVFASEVGAGASIGHHASVSRSVLEEGVQLSPWADLQSAKVGFGATIGLSAVIQGGEVPAGATVAPHARVRPGCPVS